MRKERKRKNEEKKEIRNDSIKSSKESNLFRSFVLADLLLRLVAFFVMLFTNSIGISDINFVWLTLPLWTSAFVLSVIFVLLGVIVLGESKDNLFD